MEAQDATPIGELTLRWLSDATTSEVEVTLSIVLIIRDLKQDGMNDLADHLLRRVFHSDERHALKYDPGDEPAIEIQNVL